MQDPMIHLNTANTSVNSFETTETMLMGRTRSPRRGRRIAVLAACAVALAIAFPSHSFGQALVGAAASVNGQAITAGQCSSSKRHWIGHRGREDLPSTQQQLPGEWRGG